MDEVIQRFNQAGVRYVVIRGQAVRLKGMPRFSMDWNFLIPPSDGENIARISELLGGELDLPLGPRGENFIQTYQTRWGVIQFHLGVPGLPRFEEVERQAVMHKLESGTPVRCVSGQHLLESKRAANRPQDQTDIEFLVEKQKSGKLQ